MTSRFSTYRKFSRHRLRQAERSHTRLDIQGLRMVAVLTVFACHLWDWPRGGFVGVDVFFVISGFLITGNLLRTAETRGNVSFRQFYWNRIRRIVPAATVVLVFTYVAAMLVFLPFRTHQVGVDAMFAFIFLSNWRFAVEGTDYFTADSSVSPLQHYWSLSIEEQFYFVWPALIFLIGVVVVRKTWTHEKRMRLAGAAMAVIVAASLGYALYQTAASPTWAYFDTFARVWELGFGALLATMVGVLGRIPAAVRPALSWAGVGLIAASVFLISEGAAGFPAPWAILPVVGAGLVIAAGVGGQPRYQAFLCNPVSTYVGDISYSLYLVHWPIIIILGAVMEPTPSFYVIVVAVAFALAIASYHFVENPLRRADWGKFRIALHEIARKRYEPRPSSRYAAMAALALVTVAAVAFAVQPNQPATVAQKSEAIDLTAEERLPLPPLGPLGSALQAEIATALKASDWPALTPSMDSVISDPVTDPRVTACGNPAAPEADTCTFGSPTAPIRMVLTGDSIAIAYAIPLRDIALNSGGQIQLNIQAMDGCQFVDEWMSNEDQSVVNACPARKQHTIDVINATKPSMVIIANQYDKKAVHGRNEVLSESQWMASLRTITEKFSANTGKIVFLSAPPSDVLIGDCYGIRSSTPEKCESQILKQWTEVAWAENKLAETVGGVWIDSRPWLCSQGECPSFVGTTPTKRDRKHITYEYGQKIAPVISESFRTAGVFPNSP